MAKKMISIDSNTADRLKRIHELAGMTNDSAIIRIALKLLEADLRVYTLKRLKELEKEN